MLLIKVKVLYVKIVSYDRKTTKRKIGFRSTTVLNECYLPLLVPYVFHETLKSFHELLDALAIDDDIPRNIDFVGTDPTNARIPFGPQLNNGLS